MSATNPFPPALLKHLEFAGMRQRDFAKKCGISQGLVQKWLTLESAPSPETSEAIVAALGLTDTARDDLLDLVVAAHLKGRLLDRYLVMLSKLKGYESRIQALEAANQSVGKHRKNTGARSGSRSGRQSGS